MELNWNEDWVKEIRKLEFVAEEITRLISCDYLQI